MKTCKQCLHDEVCGLTHCDQTVPCEKFLAGWISVEDRLPEMKTDVLMYFNIEKNMAAGFLCDTDEDKTMWCAYTDDGYYTDCDYEPTHWMPLPEPPKEEHT